MVVEQEEEEEEAAAANREEETLEEAASGGAEDSGEEEGTGLRSAAAILSPKPRRRNRGPATRGSPAPPRPPPIAKPWARRSSRPGAGERRGAKPRPLRLLLPSPPPPRPAPGGCARRLGPAGASCGRPEEVEGAGGRGSGHPALRLPETPLSAIPYAG